MTVPTHSCLLVKCRLGQFARFPDVLFLCIDTFYDVHRQNVLLTESANQNVSLVMKSCPLGYFLFPASEHICIIVSYVVFFFCLKKVIICSRPLTIK